MLLLEENDKMSLSVFNGPLLCSSTGILLRSGSHAMQTIRVADELLDKMKEISREGG